MSSVYVVHNKKSFEGVEYRWKNTIGMEQLVYFKGGKVKLKLDTFKSLTWVN